MTPSLNFRTVLVTSNKKKTKNQKNPVGYVLLPTMLFLSPVKKEKKKSFSAPSHEWRADS